MVIKWKDKSVKETGKRKVQCTIQEEYCSGVPCEAEYAQQHFRGTVGWVLF